MQRRSKRNYIGLLVAVVFIMQIFALPAFGTEIEKSVDKTDAMLGEDLAYTIRVNFTENASDVTIVDYLPDGLVFINDSQNGTLEGKNITWDLGDVNEGIVQTLLNVSIAEMYNGTAIANNSVNLSYEVNESTYILNASSQEVGIGGSTQEANVTFVIGGYEYQGLIVSAMNEMDLSLNITIYRTDNIPEDINLSTQDVIFMDNALGLDTLSKIEQTVNDAKEQNNASAISIGDPPYNYLANVNLTDHPWIDQYWRNGGFENIKRMLAYLGVNFCGLNATIQEPIVLPEDFIYHPDSVEIFKNLTEYLAWYGNDTGTHHLYDPGKPTVGIRTFKAMYAVGHTEVPDALVRGFEARGVNVIPICELVLNTTFYMVNDTSIVDTIISIKSFRMNSGSPETAIADLERLNVSVLKAVTDHYQTVEEWYESKHGLSISLIAAYVAQPELDGVIEPMLISGRKIDPITGVPYHSPIAEQVDWLVNRTIAWTTLKHMNNSDKKVAILYYNHPPGKASVGASYLNIMSSIANLLNGMEERGYTVGNTTPNGTELRDLILLQGRNIGVWAPDEIKKIVEAGNVTLIPESEYLKWFNDLPESKRNEVITMWGEPPGKIMVYTNESGKKYLVIPKIVFGNVLLAPEPSVGTSQDQAVMYHDKSIPPNHQYIAFYFWLKRDFGANAVVHVGTHATHEWRPGKEVGLSIKNCWPVILMQDLPNPYIYIMDNIGEGTQAKRRGMADIIDHLTPPIIAAGLYGNLSDLESKISLYDLAQNGTMKNKYKESIIELCRDLNMDKDLGIDLNETIGNETAFEEFLEELHDYLYVLKTEYMPYGLHILGEPPSGDKLVSMVISMLGYEFKEYVVQTNLSENCTKQLLEEVIFNETSPEDAQDIVLGSTSEELTNYLNLSIIYASNLKACQIETSRVLDALEDKYIPPAPGNDPIRNPDALPTGRDFYSFDPRIIPTKEAWEVGKEMADQLLALHLNKTGEYPRKVAFVLWSVELMRHYGVSESEILYLMGVEPVWDKNGRVTEVKLINCSELGRPRIDVIMTPSGLYRDHFSTRMVLLDQAVRLAAEANDTECPGYVNYVKEDSEAIYEWLINNGYNESIARDLSMARIFSEAPGSYGTGLPEAIHESHTWENESRIADLYISRMSHIYGENIRGDQHIKDLFKQNLDGVEVAVHIDSSNLYSTLDNDDVFQYLGGLNLAVRSVTGESPDLYITNFQDPSNPVTETLSNFLTRELRTRYFNPHWIEGMQEHGYCGAKAMSELFENLWGWEATSPEIVTDYMWSEVFEVYVQDKYDMGLEDWFNENNPYAQQSITARMLEAIRKEYWNPSDDVKRAITEAYTKSVEEYGITCCGHTCGNPFINDYVSGILSAPMEAESSEVEQSTQRYSSGGGGGSRTEEEKGLANETAEVSGVSKVGEELKKPPEETGESAEKVKKGRVMKEEEPASAIPISGAPLMGLIAVIAILVFVGIGFWLKARKR
jgi:cobaltochelatase CobN